MDPSPTAEIPIDALYREALVQLQARHFEQAEAYFQQVLQAQPDHADALRDLGILYYLQAQYATALPYLQQAVIQAPEQAMQYYSLGLVLEQLGQIEPAIAAYQQALDRDGRHVDAANQLGNLLQQHQQFDRAAACYRQIIATVPNYYGSYLNLGNVLLQQGQIEAAIATYQQALQLQPQDPDTLYNLGVAQMAQGHVSEAATCFAASFQAQKEYTTAIQYYLQVTAAGAGDAALYLAFASCYQALQQYEDAINTYQQGIARFPNSILLHLHHIWLLRDCGLTEAAIAAAEAACQALPDEVGLRLEWQRLLPILYETPEEIEAYRQRFARELEAVLASIALDTPAQWAAALRGIGYNTNFYLQYQCRNDRDLQVRYGEFIHQVMQANYPHWSQPLTVPPIRNGKIRVGYVSAFFVNNTAVTWAVGWLKYRHRDDFEIYSYYTGAETDQITETFRIYSDVWHHIPNDLEAVCQQIRQDDLHILVYLDLGMYGLNLQMAGLRLAPVQCAARAHPITPGIPTIDYFLSSDLMEPEEAQSHYAETLIRLPGIGVSYEKPETPAQIRSRAEQQLRQDAIVYLSSQTIFKYLPQYDLLFPQIALQVPQAQFVFISPTNGLIKQQLARRLQRAFASYGLESQDWCVIVPRQDKVGFASLNYNADVFLDTLDWSGDNTALHAIAFGLPIVTRPGQWMRGRHAYAFLRVLQVEATIARDEAEYVAIAVRLGLDRQWRDQIKQQMAARADLLYDDRVSLQALEDFYCQVVL